MIQRVQSFYLFLVAILITVLFFTKFITMNGSELCVTDSTYLIILTAVIVLLALGTIFCFFNRTLQVRICIFNMLLMLGWYAMAAYVSWQRFDFTHHEDIDISLVITFPLISIILTYLAIRGILKDDALVKSYDRLR